MIKILLIISIIFSPLTSIYAYTLKSAAQDSYPKYYLSNGKMKGICVDIIKAIEKISPEIKIIGYNKFLPFKRLQEYLNIGKINIFFGLKKTDERLKKYIFLKTPLYKLKYVIAVRADDKIKINNLNEFKLACKNNSIITIRGSASYKFLRKFKGVSIIEANNVKKLLKMLILKHGRMGFYHNLALITAIKQYNFQNKIKILPINFPSYYQYVALYKKTHPQIVHILNNSLIKLKKIGKLRRIENRYFTLKN